MLITYEFVDGTKVEIEVDEKMGNEIKELDRLEYNNKHKETRRHTTLNNGFDESEWLACDDLNPINIIHAAEEEKKLRDAFECLNESQRDLVKSMFLIGMTGKEYAEKMGVSPAAITGQLNTIRKKLKKFCNHP